MSGLSIAITGSGQLFQIWPTHAMKRFPKATIYDQSAGVTALRRAEVKLGQSGLLDPAGQAAARRTEANIAAPPDVDTTVTFEGSAQNGTVRVTCRRGTEKTFQVRLTGLDDDSVRQAFYHVDAAITLCAAGPVMA